jgi:hypothetical protein
MKSLKKCRSRGTDEKPNFRDALAQHTAQRSETEIDFSCGFGINQWQYGGQ